MDPCDLSAVEARRMIGAKALSPVELMQSCLDRIEATNGTLNAIVTLDGEGALATAREAERAVMAGAALGRLHGLPVAVKDGSDTAGMRTTHGSLIYADHVPEADDAGVARLRGAGAIPFAKTNMPEFGAGANTVNRVFGATGNPFDPVKTSAGSSGGSAAALAAGMCPLATGSDYGGSLRTPAAFCGVAGFRPSFGVAPAPDTASFLSPWGVHGPMGRSTADAALLLSAQAAHDPRDPFSHPGVAALADPIPAADLGTLRIARSADLGCCPVAREVAALFEERVTGAVGSTDATPDFGPVHDVFEITRGIAFLSSHHERLKTQRALLDRNVIDNCERGLAFTAADVAWAHREQAALHRRFHAFFEEYDVLLAPAAAVPPFPHAQLFVEEIDGVAMPTYMRWLALCYAPTMAFATAAAIPCGVDAGGMPFGIQVIGRKGSDRTVLAAALALEARFAESPATARPVPDLARLAC